MNLAPWRYPHLFTLWHNWLEQGQNQQLDIWLKRYFKAHKKFGKKDRKAYADALFNAMRSLQLICALEHSYQHNDVDWLAWDQQWQPSHASDITAEAFWYWLILHHHSDTPAPRELTDVNARAAAYQSNDWSQQTPLSPAYLLWHGLRPQWAKYLQERQQLSHWSDSDLEHFISQQNQIAPVWLRPQGISVAQAQQDLAAEAINTEPHETMLKVMGDYRITHSQVYQSGHIELQDAASQLLAQAVNAQAGDRVWDVCAGAGGKSVAIAAAMQNCGSILATDIRKHALVELNKRATRAGFDCIRTQTMDATQMTGQTLEPFDRILIDAPCSASGTWRRSPDSRWRLEYLNQYHPIQASLLTNTAKYLASGGYLIYATCSWLYEENEAQIERFLHAHTNFSLVTQKIVGNPDLDADTMFFAVLQKD